MWLWMIQRRLRWVVYVFVVVATLLAMALAKLLGGTGQSAMPGS